MFLVCVMLLIIHKISQSGHADLYPDLKVNFIFGRNPTLTIYSDEGAVLDTIDLAPVSVLFTSLLLLCSPVYILFIN